MLDRYLDKHVALIQSSNSDQDNLLGGLEKELASHQLRRPIPSYVNTLRQLRKESQSINGNQQEIQFAKTFQAKLSDLSSEFELPENHFDINTDGEPLIVKEGHGEHLISPTHFENSAYFSHPHADHQLNYSAQQLPKIRIGRYVRFGRNSAVNAGGDVHIGDGVWLSPGAQLLRQDHDPYGRLSIGSRTVAMTNLPPVRLCDYSWVGREAIIGWNADYLGKGCIVGLRSFVNSWVGDYSIVGNQGKILQYLPYKSWLMESYNPTVEQILQISDWEAVNTDWLTQYRDEDIIFPRTHEYLSALSNNSEKNSPVLVAGPDAIDIVPWFSDRPTDVISSSRSGFAKLLQWAQNVGQKRLRVRADLHCDALPFMTGGNYHYRRKLGYGVVVINANQDEHPIPNINEALRVCAPNGVVLYPISAYEELKSITSNAFTRRADITLGHRIFACFEKI